MILGIYGTGGSGRELYEMIERSSLVDNWDEILFIDDMKERGFIYGRRVIPFVDVVEQYTPDAIKIVIAAGEPRVREILREKVESKEYNLETIIGESSMISSTAIIGEGVIIKEGVIVSAGAYINKNVCINSKAIIGHDVCVGSDCQISSFSIIAGRSNIENKVYVGASSAIREDVMIGKNSIVSMGAIVLKSVDENKIVMGNPARVIAENTSGKVFK